MVRGEIQYVYYALSIGRCIEKACSLYAYVCLQRPYRVEGKNKADRHKGTKIHTI